MALVCLVFWHSLRWKVIDFSIGGGFTKWIF
jgi:hypothetical protein